MFFGARSAADSVLKTPAGMIEQATAKAIASAAKIAASRLKAELSGYSSAVGTVATAKFKAVVRTTVGCSESYSIATATGITSYVAVAVTFAPKAVPSGRTCALHLPAF